MYNLAIRKCTSPPPLAPRLKIFKLKFTTPDLLNQRQTCYHLSQRGEHEILSYLAEETNSRVELFCWTTMHVRILPGRHKPCCVSNSTGTSSSILYIVRIWHSPTFYLFQTWRSTLLANASQMTRTWRMLLNNQTATWHGTGIHKLVPSYDKCLNVKCNYVEK